MKDPKFGYHWIWMLPIVYAQVAVSWITKVFHSIKIKVMLKLNPEISELSKLSGIKK
jgi:hypothetical protein